MQEPKDVFRNQTKAKMECLNGLQNFFLTMVTVYTIIMYILLFQLA